MDFRTRRDFVDPRPGLEAEFDAVRTQLRKERAEPTTIGDRLRLWLDEWRLHREMVTKPGRAARW